MKNKNKDECLNSNQKPTKTTFPRWKATFFMMTLCTFQVCMAISFSLLVLLFAYFVSYEMYISYLWAMHGIISVMIMIVLPVIAILIMPRLFMLCGEDFKETRTLTVKLLHFIVPRGYIYAGIVLISGMFSSETVSVVWGSNLTMTSGIMIAIILCFIGLCTIIETCYQINKYHTEQIEWAGDK